MISLSTDGSGGPEKPSTTGMVMTIGRLLAAPGLPAQARRTLKRADRGFDVLDGLLRSGAPVPACWHVTDQADEAACTRATLVYDTLSEALRETGGAPTCFAARLCAVAEWRELDTALRVGAPLPEPWRG